MNNYRKNERGSAVILALALLSLMLILIMSFVTNALLDSRIAETKKQLHNVQNISNIALNRALMNLKYYVINHDTEVGKFNNFVSWAYDGDLPHNGSTENPPADNNINNDGYNEYREADSGDSDYEALRMAYDGIKEAMDTQLYDNNDDIYLYRYPTHRDSNDDKITDSSDYWFKGAFSQQPRWIYLYEDPNNTNSPKIGRFAYAVLPDKGQININSLVGGPLNVIDEDRTGDNTNEFQAGQIVVNEYANEDEQKKISNTSDSNIFGEVIKDGTNIYAQRGNDISNFINFNISDKRVINALYQKFVFNQNLYPSDGEKFYVNDGDDPDIKPDVKPRFNLTAPASYDGKNTTDIMADLPFLNNIGDTQGTFADITARRNQIAANLLDLGDSDDIPTSDVPAASWTVNNAPTYTGNEKTPYLSAMAVNTTVELNNNLTNRSLNFNFYPQFELVDLYGTGGNGYNIDFKFTNFSTEFDLSGNTRIKAYAKIRVKAKVKIKIGRLELEREVTIPTPITQQFEFSIEDLQDFAATKGSSVTLPRVKVENIFSTTTNCAVLSGWDKANDDDLYQTNQLFDDENPITVTIDDYTTFLSTFVSANDSIIKAYAKEKAFTPGTQIKFEGSITGITLASDMMTVTEVTDVTDLPATSGLQGREILSLDEITNPNGTFDSCVFVLKKGTTGIDYANIDTPKSYGDTSGNLYSVNGVKLFSLKSEDPRVNLNASDWEWKSDMNSFDPDATPSVLKTFDNAKFQHIADIDLANKFNDPSTFTYSTLAGVSRGKAWETINILDATGNLNRGEFEDFVWKAEIQAIDVATGTSSSDGDGGILNQIALNNGAPFKINIATTSKDIWRGLLYGLQYDSDGDGTLDTEVFAADDDLKTFIDNIVNEIAGDPSILQCRSDLVELIETANTGLSSNLTDLQKYGIIDGIMHLIKVEQYPEEFQILIVAQSINPNSLADDISKTITATEKVLVTVRRTGDEFKIIKKEKMPF